jgi:hypothetical protein
MWTVGRCQKSVKKFFSKTSGAKKKEREILSRESYKGSNNIKIELDG